MLYTYLTVGLAGAVGGMLRVFLGQVLINVFPLMTFPYPILMINLIGSFILGLFLRYIDLNQNKGINQRTKAAISTGFLGSFTTFSTFSAEALQLLQQSLIMSFIFYVILSFLGGIFFAYLGFKTASYLQSKKSQAMGRSS